MTSSRSQKKATALTSEWRSVVARIVALALAGFVLELVGGQTLLSKSLSSTAAKLFAPVLSWSYSSGDDQHVSDLIAVVDVDIPLVQQTAGGWPFSYRHHARILDQIRRQKPKALFVDFQFQSPREDPTLLQFQESLCAFKADRIPVFLAVGTETSEGLLRPELESLRDPSGEPCFTKVAVQYEPSPIDQIAWTYALRSSNGHETIRSAGLAMAEAMKDRAIEVGHEQMPTMGLTWAGGKSGQGPKWLDGSSEQNEEEHAELVSRHYCKEISAKDLFPLPEWIAAVTGEVADMRPACPRYQSLPASWLTVPKTPLQIQDLKQRLTGRGVFYGGSFDANDLALSPIHGRIPGIFLHAQAADNLMRYGDDWRRSHMGGRNIHGHVQEHAVVFLGFLVISIAFSIGRSLLERLWTTIKVVEEVFFKNRARRMVQWCKEISAKFMTWLPESLQIVVALVFEKLAEFMVRIGWFYTSLLIASIPVAWFLENIFDISLIAYAPLLAFTLLGEVFMYFEDAGKAVDKHAHQKFH